MLESAALSVSMPGLRAYRTTTSELSAGVKEHFTVARVERGRSEWWSRGAIWKTAPGTILVKQPGDVHRNLAIDGALTFTAVMLPMDDVLRVRDPRTVLSTAQLDLGDERAAPFHRLHDAITTGADRLALEVAVTEAVAAYARLGHARSQHTRPVRRAMEYLREQLAAPVTLDDLATHAGLDKFHLCRAFRAQIGMPPHAYLTHLRIQRAKTLLARGVRASELAPCVGLYDQSQLTRHFRRIVGTTPARYGKDAL